MVFDLDQILSELSAPAPVRQETPSEKAAVAHEGTGEPALFDPEQLSPVRKAAAAAVPQPSPSAGSPEEEASAAEAPTAGHSAPEASASAEPPVAQAPAVTPTAAQSPGEDAPKPAADRTQRRAGAVLWRLAVMAAELGVIVFLIMRLF